MSGVRGTPAPTAQEFLAVMRRLRTANPDGYRAVVAEMRTMADANERARRGGS